MHYKKTNEEFDKYQNNKNVNTDLTNGCVSVTFFAKNPEHLPPFKRVGDIIRIHRANIGQYRNYKTFCANVDFGSSWAIFKGAELEDVEMEIENH